MNDWSYLHAKNPGKIEWRLLRVRKQLEKNTSICLRDTTLGAKLFPPGSEPVIAFDHCAQDGKQYLPIPNVAEYLVLRIPAGGNMTDSSRVLDLVRPLWLYESLRIQTLLTQPHNVKIPFGIDKPTGDMPDEYIKG